MIFFHIPLVETKEAINLYLDNDSNVKYYFGEVNEDVCSSRIRSKLFDEVVNLGSTKAIFYGHDHMNNISLEYKGVRLTYGMSIGYLATPGIEDKTDYRGGTLITLKNDTEISYENPVITDKLDTTLVNFVDGSVKINGTTATSSEYNYDSSTGTLTVNLASVGESSSSVVTFEVTKKS